MATKIFLGFHVLLWIPYGIFCFFQPGYLESAAGVAATSPTASVELRSMYGGLQAAIGALALAGLLRESLRPVALLTLLFLTAGLGTTRLLGAVLDGDAAAYTLGAVAFELGSALVAAWLLRREAPLTAPAH